VADIPELALQENQLSEQVALRPCTTCGQNAELEVMQTVPVL